MHKNGISVLGGKLFGKIKCGTHIWKLGVLFSSHQLDIYLYYHF